MSAHPMDKHYLKETAKMIDLLKEFLIKGGAAEDWMKHIK